MADLTVARLTALLREADENENDLLRRASRWLEYDKLAVWLLPRLGTVPAEPRDCPYCGKGPCPHPDVFNPALGPKSSCRYLHPEKCGSGSALPRSPSAAAIEVVARDFIAGYGDQCTPWDSPYTTDADREENRAEACRLLRAYLAAEAAAHE